MDRNGSRTTIASLLPSSENRFEPIKKIKDLIYHSMAIVIMIVISILSILMWPLSAMNNNPSNRVERSRRIRATRQNLADPNSAYYRIGEHRELQLKGIQTIPHAQKVSLRSLDGNCQALGYRQILSIRNEYSEKEKKNIRKYNLSDYKWFSYTKVDELITILERAFYTMGVQNGTKVLIYAETRFEWFLCANAILRNGGIVATIYSTLGEEALRYGIEETQATVLITTESLLSQLPKTMCSTIQHLVWFENIKRKGDREQDKPKELSHYTHIECINYEQLLEKGRSASDAPIYDPNNNTIEGSTPAVILYTSGSTGKPKGVVLTHQNFVHTMKAVYTLISDQMLADYKQHCWYGYLPLAHILEFIAENAMFCIGFRIGYGSPFTMTDLSTGIIKGQPGDLTLLKPTIIPAVPLVLERIRKTIMEKLELHSPLFTHLASYLSIYKTFWLVNGYDTPIFDMLISTRFRKMFGGRVQFMMIGGAALSAETQTLMRALLNIQILIGYGSTETCGGNFVSDLEDLSVGWTGAPLFGILARLADWPEGGYTSRDRPNPRGELHIGGESVSSGYLNQPELTNEAFYNENGVQWFRTGDIVEVNQLGEFRIVDRKKDLVKLQHGEFVSLGKIESELKNCLIIDNLCVYADGKRNNVVALIMPNWNVLKRLAIKYLSEQPQHQSGSSLTPTSISQIELEQLINNSMFVHYIYKNVEEFCLKETKLSKTEIPVRIHLCKEEWTPNNDLLTAAMKIKRVNIVRFYEKQIEAMYQMETNKS